MKKYFHLLIVCLMLFLPMTTVSAAYENNEKIIPKEIRDADIEKQINEALNKNKINTLSDRDYYYTTEVVETKYKTVGGFAGGQLLGGYRFQTGGGFYWDESGGPTIGGNVSFSAPYKLVGFLVNLGIASTNSSYGKYVSVPNTYQYFKLYVEKTMEVRKVNVYRQKYTGGTKELWDTMYPSTPYSQNQYAKSV
ncbi:hypothetical protein K144316041_p10300 (plasmid) [Clostridium tetani]|uniref:hypothetical protein n=1 Tax=Clostridium tetani TaxID=1513 RepID=UPI00100B41FF|nr:hypothetical protein [Clostridium tetani]RXI49223.1 hypothetical protein DP124_13250 [Clostridium tetani]RXI56621.1 hypothetical protein DP122_02200 [Clostridium tetani]RXM72395.1 hypothetical protein DP139_01385 [Clostridium tetani]BDR74102.1 hypothetical protein K144316041_p10300 [Clostridium tetani]